MLTAHTDFEKAEVFGNFFTSVFNGPFVYGGTNCTRCWNFADIFFSDSVKIMRFYDFARTPVS